MQNQLLFNTQVKTAVLIKNFTVTDVRTFVLVKEKHLKRFGC